MITVLLADDEPLFRSGLAMLVSAAPDMSVVADVGDGQAAVDTVRALHPDVAVLDVRMPVLDGVQATERIVRQVAAGAAGPPTRVLALTTFNAAEAVYGTLRAGASGFLLKHAAPADLLAAVRAVAAGDGWLDPSVVPHLLREISARGDSSVELSRQVRELTVRERDVLQLIAHGRSNADIATLRCLSEGTVKTHVGNVLRKLGATDRAQAAVIAYRSGLVGWRDPVPPDPMAAAVATRPHIWPPRLRGRRSAPGAG